MEFLGTKEISMACLNPWFSQVSLGLQQAIPSPLGPTRLGGYWLLQYASGRMQTPLSDPAPIALYFGYSDW